MPDRIHDRCLHEGELAEMGTNIKAILADVGALKKTMNNGLKIDVALCKQGLNRAWWWLGSMSVAMMGVAIKVIIF